MFSIHTTNLSQNLLQFLRRSKGKTLVHAHEHSTNAQLLYKELLDSDDLSMRLPQFGLSSVMKLDDK
jgi:hypothetical protein